MVKIIIVGVFLFSFDFRFDDMFLKRVDVYFSFVAFFLSFLYLNS